MLERLRKGRRRHTASGCDIRRQHPPECVEDVREDISVFVGKRDHVAGLIIGVRAGRAIVESHADFPIQRIIRKQRNIAPVVDKLGLPAVAVENHGGHDRRAAAGQKRAVGGRRVAALALLAQMLLGLDGAAGPVEDCDRGIALRIDG